MSVNLLVNIYMVEQSFGLFLKTIKEFKKPLGIYELSKMFLKKSPT